jgi:glycosyltransferase involved in cell wall biosynthesis
MLTILIVDSKPMHGGGQRMITELCLALHDFRTVVVRPECAPEEDAVYAASAVIRMRFPSWPSGLSRPAGMIAALPAALTAAYRLGRLSRTERPALIIVNELYAAIPLVLLRLAGIRPRWCFWAHSCDLHLGAATRRLLATASAIIGVSQAVIGTLKSPGMPPALVIRNALTLPGSIELSAPLPAVANPSTWTALYCGRLDANKNVAGLLRGWALAQTRLNGMGPSRLLVAGDGPERTALERMTAALKLETEVHFLGWRSDATTVMHHVDAVILPSHQEALGLALIEGQLRGCAVLGTPVGGIPEVIQDGVTGILARSPKPDDLAEALVRLRHQGPALRGAGTLHAQRVFSTARFQREVRDLTLHLTRLGQVPPPHLSCYAEIRPHAEKRIAAQPVSSHPLLSIVTVVRNGRHLLERCRASVLAQTWPAIEHIIVDGGSSDGTREWLAAQNDGAMTWISEPDHGISDAFNKGIALSRGAFVGILNADDAWLPESAERSVRALQDNPWATWSFGGCDFTIGGQVVLHRDGDPAYARTIHRWMPVINHPTVVMRREAYEQHGLFRLELRLAMDYDLLLRFHRIGLRGICIPHTLALMELGGASNGNNVRRAHREASLVSLSHGRSAIPAYFDYLRIGILPRSRQLAIRMGLQGPWRKLKRGMRSTMAASHTD